jgi:predicted acetyltransferase
VSFTFYEPGPLIDHDLALVLATTTPAVPEQELVPSYRFRMVRPGTTIVLGSIELRVGDTAPIVLYYGHIGYGVTPAYRGHHYAARSCRLLLPLARRHGMQTLWITCNPGNLASRRTCELAGAQFVEIVDVPISSELYRRGEQQKCRYRIDL